MGLQDDDYNALTPNQQGKEWNIFYDGSLNGGTAENGQFTVSYSDPATAYSLRHAESNPDWRQYIL